MSIFSFIENVNINIGPVKINLKTKKQRQDAGGALVIFGLVLYLVFLFSAYLPKIAVDIIQNIGIVIIVVGALLRQI